MRLCIFSALGRAVSAQWGCDSYMRPAGSVAAGTTRAGQQSTLYFSEEGLSRQNQTNHYYFKQMCLPLVMSTLIYIRDRKKLWKLIAGRPSIRDNAGHGHGH